MRFSIRIQLSERSSRIRKIPIRYDPAEEATRPQTTTSPRKKATATKKTKKGNAAKHRARGVSPRRRLTATQTTVMNTARVPAVSGPMPVASPTSSQAVPTGAVDSRCNVGAGARLIAGASGSLYDTALNFIDPSTNKDKFYILQLVGSSAGFHVFRRWGRNGTAGQMKTDGPLDLTAAVAHFESKFKSKTGLAFNDRNLASLAGKYKITKRLKEARAGTGELTVSLMWDNHGAVRNDLDLHVKAPSGETIMFSHRRSACGGVLDVDRQQQADEPVENIVWARAPQGKYVISVHNYSASHPNMTPFKVRFLVKGKSEMIDGYMPANSAHGKPLLVKELFN